MKILSFCSPTIYDDKSVISVEAAELEVDTASLHHVEQWRVLEQLKENTDTEK